MSVPGSSGAPRVLGVFGDAPDPSFISQAAEVLRRGGLVAFPTETVYGLGADATNAAAVTRLNQVKGRPPEKPYSLHLHSPEQMRPYVSSIPAVAAKLIERFWPGPLTVVLPGTDGKTVGFRLPDHPIARAFLRACDVPVAAPSANRSGSPPPTDAREVLAALNGSVECLLDGGPTRFGKESTVVEIVNGRVEIRREGAISAEAIRSVTG
jgi:L-threonylcarbamoyladenylate synthase